MASIEELLYAPIKGFESNPGYLIYENGRIWSLYSKIFLKVNVNRGGYSRVILRKDNKNYKKFVHRLMLETFIGPCPVKKECRHLDGNPQNNHISNLKWGTRYDNIDDKIKHGTLPIGERNPASRLTEAQVKLIRELYKTTKTSTYKLAKEFGVAVMTISDILTYKTWTHI